MHHQTKPHFYSVCKKEKSIAKGFYSLHGFGDNRYIKIMNEKKFYLLDHKWLFLFGFIFYLIFPVLIGTNDMFKGYPGMDLYQQYFSLIPSSKIIIYLLICFAWLVAFYAGHFLYKMLKPEKKELRLYNTGYADYGVHYIAAFLVLLLFIFSWLARSSIFGGYATYDIAARGKLSTLLIIFNFFILYQLVSRHKLSWYLIAGTAANCLLLLSMGGRMYVFQTLIVILVYKTSFAPRRWNLIKVSGLAIAGFFVGAVSGVWRMSTSFSLSKAGYSFFAEPVFTWISAGTFLTANKIPLINVPLNFITSFFNLIPNTFINLRQYVVSAQGMGYTYLSPLGADSVWSTYVINFGALGSVLFIFLTGFLLNFLRDLSTRSRFCAVYYIMVCGLLPFQFFRDGFYIINKQLFFNFLLFPAVLLYVIKLVKYLNTQYQGSHRRESSTRFRLVKD